MARKKVCRKSGKVKFDSHERAATRAGIILNKPGVTVKELGTYRCVHCNHWHLTSHVYDPALETM